MKNSMRLSLLLTLGLFVSACDAVIVEDYPEVPAYYIDGDFERATIQGSIVTIVAGNPFPGRGKGFADRVRALMKDQVEGIPANFCARHDATTKRPHKVVAVFNPRRDVDNQTICRLEMKTPRVADRPGRVSLIMSFCIGDDLKSGTRGRVGNVTGENDPKFVSLSSR